MNYSEIRAIIDFIGEDMTSGQAADLMVSIMGLSLADKFELYDTCYGELYELIAMHLMELGVL